MLFTGDCPPAPHLAGDTRWTDGAAAGTAFGAGHPSGDELDCGRVVNCAGDPAAATQQGAVQLQLHVARLDESGSRPLTCTPVRRTADGNWTRIRLRAGGAGDRQADFDLRPGRPRRESDPGRRRVRPLAEQGYTTGPRSAVCVRRGAGEETFAEVELPVEAAQSASPGPVRPALARRGLKRARAGRGATPLSGTGCRCSRRGDALRFGSWGTDPMTLQLADATGAPVVRWRG